MSADGKLVQRTQDEEKEDKEWELNAAATDSAVKAQSAAATVLSLCAVVSYCAGPACAPLATLFSTSAVIVQASGPTAKSEVETLYTLQKASELKHYIVACQVFWEWLTSRQSIIDSDNHQNIGTYATYIGDLNRDFISANSALSVAVNTLDLSWDKPDVRIAVANCVSSLLAAHSVACRLLAKTALEHKAQGRQDAYLDFKQQFLNACTTMTNIHREKEKSLNAAISAEQEKRRKQLVGPYTAWNWMGTPFGSLGKRMLDEFTDRREYYGGRGFSRSLAYVDGEAQKKRERLEKHLERGVRNTKAIIAVWPDVLARTQKYLTPAIPAAHKPAVLGNETHDATPWLKDAVTVAYAYELKTEDGVSDLSQWTDPLPVKLAPDADPNASIVCMELPTLELDDFGFRTKTFRQVYHRKTLADGTVVDKTSDGKFILARSSERVGKSTFVDSA
ncbi:hypothetical protein B0H19DRAFT_1249358 [Mycena capillaripes]|nr:hypothetical protein B0H19DRAFT_1249358 [Mycena capillaripes]